MGCATKTPCALEWRYVCVSILHYGLQLVPGVIPFRFFISNSLGRPSHSTGVAYMHKCKALHGVFEKRSFVMMLYKREML